MRRLIIVSLFLVYAASMLFAHALPGETKDKPLFAPDKIKIQLTAEAYARTYVPEEMYAEAPSFGIAELDYLLAEIGTTKIIRAHRKLKDTVWEQQTGFNRWFILSVPVGTEILSTAEMLKSSSYIESAMPEGYFYPAYIPNDPYYANNWGHNNTAQLPAWVGGINGSHSGPLVGAIGFDADAQPAWDDTQGLGSASIIIAIVDTGVDTSHPDLRLVAGYDFGNNDSNPNPDVNTEDAGHGTACAGIASAIGNNSLGAAGIAAGCSVMPLKVSDSQGHLEWTYSINALTYAGDHNVDIISISLGGNAVEQSLYDLYELAIDYAYSHGALLFASTGNENHGTIRYPAWSAKVIAVGAASPDGRRKSNYSDDGEYWWGSNWGAPTPDHPAAVDIMGPTILPTTDIIGANGYTDSNYYQFFNGTSCACPYVAGVAALLLSKYPSMSQAGVRSRLMMSATDMTLDAETGWDAYTGYGLVNAAEVLDFYDFEWTGAYSSDWSDYRNWAVAVPNSNSDVYIGTVEAGHFYPVINNGNAACKSLTIYPGASLTIVNTNLAVVEDLMVYGNFQQTGTGDITINGKVIWGSGSTASVTASTAEMYVKGHMYFRSGSNIQINNGTIEFFGTESAGIYVNATARISSLRSNKGGIYYLGISPTSTHDFHIQGNLTVLTDRILKNEHPGTVFIKGSFLNNTLGAFWFTSGTVCFNGSINQSLQNNSNLTCFYNNLNVAMTNNAVLNLESNVTVRGNVNISSGVLQNNNHSITLWGNWINYAGTAAFIEGDGALVLTGTGNQYLYSEHFYAIELNKSSGEMRIVSGQEVICDRYYWTAGVYRIEGGTFTALNLVQPGIYGDIYLDSGTVNYYQLPDVRNDFNGTLHIAGGSFNVYGGSDECFWAYAAPAALYMTGGVLDFREKGFLISDATHSLTLDLSGGVIRTISGYRQYRNNVVLNGGTLELYGPNDAGVELTSGSQIYNLNINKAPLRSARNQRLNTVSAGTNLQINGTLTISQGTFDIGARTVQANNIEVYGTLKMNSAGSIMADEDFIWQNGSLSNITAGTIHCGKNWRFLSGSTVNLSAITTTLYATLPSEITASSPNAWFGTLNLTGSLVAPASLTIASASTSNLIVKGAFTMNNFDIFYLNGKTLRTENQVTVNASCTLHLGPDSVLKIYSGRSLTINSGATLAVLGAANHPATISNLTTGYYYLNVESGATISAEYGIFEYMQPQGVNVKYGSLVDAVHSFHYCTFRNGYSNQTLLTIANNQTFSVYGANFPSSTISSLYNVNKNLNLGVVTFINATGAFSGEAYDNDPYNRVNWTTTQCNLVVNDATPDIAELYVCESLTYGITVYNNSANATVIPVRVDVYFNPPSPPPSGQAGDLHFYISPLAAYGAATYTFPEITSETAGVWYSAFRVDALNEISETNENDNSYSDNIIEWLGLPDIENMTIDYNESTGTVELNWTYPEFIPYDYFRIYSSDNPMDQFNTLVGTTTNTFYTAPTPYIKRFYRVTASKEWQ